MGNVARDQVNDRALRALGWRLLIFWECELATLSDVDLAVVCIRRELAEIHDNFQEASGCRKYLGHTL